MRLLSLHSALLITKQFYIHFLRWFLEYLCDVDAMVNILCLNKAYLPLRLIFHISLKLSPVSPDPQLPSSQSVFPANQKFFPNVLIAAPPSPQLIKWNSFFAKQFFFKHFLIFKISLKAWQSFIRPCRAPAHPLKQLWMHLTVTTCFTACLLHPAANSVKADLTPSAENTAWVVPEIFVPWTNEWLPQDQGGGEGQPWN